MSAKPFATAIVSGAAFSCYGKEEHVPITRSRAAHGRAVCGFYAPGWRSMVFTTVEAARAKMERHPGFVGWAA